MFKYTKDLIGNEHSQETDLIGNERSQETNMWKESGLDGVENNMCAKKKTGLPFVNQPPDDDEYEWQQSQPLLSSGLPPYVDIHAHGESEAESIVLGTAPTPHRDYLLPSSATATESQLIVPETPRVRGENIYKCSLRGCKGVSAPTFECVAHECTRVMHWICYGSMCTKNKLSLLPDECVVCTKACYTKYERKLKSNNLQEDDVLLLTWEKDGKGGEDDPENSMAVLLNWWTAEGNYAKYRGDNNMGKTKLR